MNGGPTCSSAYCASSPRWSSCSTGVRSCFIFRRAGRRDRGAVRADVADRPRGRSRVLRRDACCSLDCSRGRWRSLFAGEMAVAYFQVHAPRAFLPIVNRGELPSFSVSFPVFRVRRRRQLERRRVDSWTAQRTPDTSARSSGMPIRPFILSETTWKTVDATPYERRDPALGRHRGAQLPSPVRDGHHPVRARRRRAPRERAWTAGARVVVLPAVPFGVQTTQLDIKGCINMNPSTQAALLARRRRVARAPGHSQVLHPERPRRRTISGRSSASCSRRRASFSRR